MNIFSEYILLIAVSKGQIPQLLILFKGFGFLHIYFLFFAEGKIKSLPCGRFGKMNIAEGKS